MRAFQPEFCCQFNYYFTFICVLFSDTWKFHRRVQFSDLSAYQINVSKWYSIYIFFDNSALTKNKTFSWDLTWQNLLERKTGSVTKYVIFYRFLVGNIIFWSITKISFHVLIPHINIYYIIRCTLIYQQYQTSEVVKPGINQISWRFIVSLILGFYCWRNLAYHISTKFTVFPSYFFSLYQICFVSIWMQQMWFNFHYSPVWREVNW